MAASVKAEASAQPEGVGCGALGGPGCACRAAVLRAFAGMTRSGAAYDSALAVAVRVFRHHHPEALGGVAELVELWVSPERLH